MNDIDHQMESQPPQRSVFVSFIIAVFSVVLVLYLLNPLSGIDLMPDMLPIVGNLDDAAATALLLSCLSYFGWELPWLRKNERRRAP